MLKFQVVLLNVWREACRHIEITQSTETIAAMLVRGMLIYSGGITAGAPFLHFGAVSTRAPDDELSRQRCLQLGRLVAGKARELFGH